MSLLQKIQISINSGILFAFINSHVLLKCIKNLSNQSVVPNDIDHIVNFVVFAFIPYMSMGYGELSTLEKIKNTTYGSLLYFLISNPIIHRTFGLLGKNECLTNAGLFLITIIYIILLICLMYFPDSTKCT